MAKKRKKFQEVINSSPLSESGLVTITGGKWTTYRQMAEETVDLAIKTSKLPEKKCITRTLKIHGAKETTERERQNWLYVYGSDKGKILALQNEDSSLALPLHPKYEFTGSEVIWAVREEMAQTLDDVLARRIRALFLDARIAKEMAPKVAQLMAKEMGKDEAWEKEQVESFLALADGYILK